MKQKAFRSKKYLKWISEQCCAACGHWPPCDPAHQRILGGGGMALKPPDNHVIPLCRDCHQAEHSNGVTAVWGVTANERRCFTEHIQRLCDQYFKSYENEQEGIKF